jgi:putative transposase
MPRLSSLLFQRACLVPYANHFHFLLDISLKSLELVKVGWMSIPAISNGFRKIQSSYAKGINKELHRTGNLFQQKAKSVLITDLEEVRRTFKYIHENPVTAGLVKRAEDWRFSTYVDYVGLRNGTLCNKKRANELLGALY